LARAKLGMRTASKIYRENGERFTASNLHKVENNDAMYVSDGSTLDTPFEQISISVMGAGAVGKSALTLRYIQGQFVSNYDPTIEDAYRKQIHLDGNTLILDILDTAGQEDFEALRTQWMKKRDGFVLVFSIIRKASLDQLQEFYDGLLEVYDENNCPPIILVGNKVDLDEKHVSHIPAPKEEMNELLEAPHNHEYTESEQVSMREKPERQITFEKAVMFGKKIGVAHYIETSAKSGYNVENMIGKIVRKIINNRYAEEQNAKKKSEDKKWWSKCQIL